VPQSSSPNSLFDCYTTHWRLEKPSALPGVDTKPNPSHSSTDLLASRYSSPGSGSRKRVQTGVAFCATCTVRLQSALLSCQVRCGTDNNANAPGGARPNPAWGVRRDGGVRDADERSGGVVCSTECGVSILGVHDAWGSGWGRIPRRCGERIACHREAAIVFGPTCRRR